MRPEELAAASIAQPVEISCQQCGKIKEPGQKFCGFCGTDFSAAQSQAEPTAPLSAPEPRASREAATYPTRDLDSLRELSFSTIYDSEESGNGWRYTVVTLVVLLCLGAIAYFQWHAQILAEWNKIVAPNSVSSTTQQASAPAANAPATPIPQAGNTAQSQT